MLIGKKNNFGRRRRKIIQVSQFWVNHHMGDLHLDFSTIQDNEGGKKEEKNKLERIKLEWKMR